jgi:2-dehydropantoate 2-reductase
MDQIITEIFSVALANGIKLRWESADAYCEHFYSRLVPPTQEHFPSMYYDLKKGKRVEIDALNGAIVRLARRKHVPVPVNETIMDMIKTKESLLSRQS